ncbi:LysR family transcriptional regulator [Burkholderia ubonensis]|uniref:LysR substrate-binding domain-containing protein n=1 Tax=Burkholderia ubonensis TaxID=101571 RepID=UPI00075A4DD2|nr:LysR substrate-binding domain-containing protein [Burkholderia ubonensis]KVN95110.1 LysR family transcriptional regulator [Burkholderia ubonensis]KVT79295.1 LysR family transcriptional regulator [Burkholderia ubonensis]
MNAPLDTALLHTFVTVADARSFTGAGRRLHLSQSAVSAQVARLEEQAGCTLLMRNTRTVSLTDQGLLLLGYARAMLNLSAEARACLGGAGAPGRLRVGASDEFACGWLPDILRRFGARHRGLALELAVDVPGNLVQAFDAGRFDLVVGSRCERGERGIRLGAEPLVWAFARHEPLPDGALPLACIPEPCPFREAALTALARAEVASRIACVSPSMAGVKAAARAGFAVTPLPRSAIDDGLRELTAADGLPPLPSVEYVLMHDAGGALVRELAQTIRDEFEMRPLGSAVAAHARGAA